MMGKEEIDLMRLQLKVLKSVERQYKGRTIDNIISNIESRLKYHKEDENG